MHIHSDVCLTMGLDMTTTRKGKERVRARARAREWAREWAGERQREWARERQGPRRRGAEKGGRARERLSNTTTTHICVFVSTRAHQRAQGV